MTMHIIFSNETQKSSFLKGYAFCKDGRLMRGGGQAAFFAQGDFDTFKNRIADGNGCFAVAVVKDNELWAAVDRIRSFPLFYGEKNGGFFLSDDPYWVRQEVADADPDPQACTEYWYMLYVLGDRTLAPRVKQLRAGELLRVHATKQGFKTRTARYYHYLHNNCYEVEQEELLHILDEIYIRAFERLLESARSAQLIVPLSGGHDSRLLACMLKRLGAKNVLCFSYGTPGNPEAKVSQYVAKSLGYPWTFISYQDFDWDATCWQTERKSFSRFSSNLSTIPPMLEDWIAIWIMKRAGMLSDDAIFCPGHIGDFSTRRYKSRPVSGAKNEDQLVDIILKQHSPRLHWEYPEKNSINCIKQHIKKSLIEMRKDQPWNPVDSFENWEWQESQAKRIVNMVRAYEFWGYGWRTPLWDPEIMDFWRRIPVSLRLRKYLYRHYLSSYSDSKFFGLFNLDAQHLNPVYPSRFSGIRFMHKVLRYHTASRYFCAYNKTVIHLLATSYFEYLRLVGKRIFSFEPVTYPWLFLDKYGVDSIWNADC